MVKTLTSSLAPYVDRLGPEIEAALRKYSCLPAGCPDPLREAMRYSLLAPGKRLRPMLVLMAAEACGGSLCGGHAGRLCRGDDPRLFAHSRRPSRHGRRRSPPRPADVPQGLRRGDGHPGRRWPAEPGLPGAGRRHSPPTVAAACCAALAEASGPCQLVGGQADDIAADRSRHRIRGHSLTANISNRFTPARPAP